MEGGGDWFWGESPVGGLNSGGEGMQVADFLLQGFQGLFSASCIEGSSLDAWGCSAATLSRYYFVFV